MVYRNQTIAEMLDHAWNLGNDKAAAALSLEMDIHHTVAIHDLTNILSPDGNDCLATMAEYDDGSFSVYGYSCYDEQGTEIDGPLSAEEGKRLLALNAKGRN